jgi:hypothetical protein
VNAESYAVFIALDGARRRLWGAYTDESDAASAARKLRMVGFDARVAPGRVIEGELVFRTDPAR